MKKKKHMKHQRTHIPLPPLPIQLYRCPECGHPYRMKGNQVELRPTDETATAWFQEYEADPATLPYALCRLCAFAKHADLLSVDEYGEGAGGYGFFWELPGEEGISQAQLSVLSRRWCTHSLEFFPDVVRNPFVYRECVQWLATLLQTCRVFPFEFLSQEVCHLMASQHPTRTSWQWKGAAFQLDCPPLSGNVTLLASWVLPVEEPLDPFLLLRFRSCLAQRILTQ